MTRHLQKSLASSKILAFTLLASPMVLIGAEAKAQGIDDPGEVGYRAACSIHEFANTGHRCPEYEEAARLVERNSVKDYWPEDYGYDNPFIDDPFNKVHRNKPLPKPAAKSTSEVCFFPQDIEQDGVCYNMAEVCGGKNDSPRCRQAGYHTPNLVTPPVPAREILNGRHGKLDVIQENRDLFRALVDFDSKVAGEVANDLGHDQVPSNGYWPEEVLHVLDLHRDDVEIVLDELDRRDRHQTMMERHAKAREDDLARQLPGVEVVDYDKLGPQTEEDPIERVARIVESNQPQPGDENLVVDFDKYGGLPCLEGDLGCGDTEDSAKVLFPGLEEDAEGDFAEGDYGEGDYGEGDYAEGDYAEGEYAEGEYAEGEYAEGDYAEGEYAEGEYAEGEYAEGEYAEGEYAEGEYAEGEYAEGEYAEGEYAEGEYAEGEYADRRDDVPLDVTTGHGESSGSGSAGSGGADYSESDFENLREWASEDAEYIDEGEQFAELYELERRNPETDSGSLRSDGGAGLDPSNAQLFFGTNNMDVELGEVDGCSQSDAERYVGRATESLGAQPGGVGASANYTLRFMEVSRDATRRFHTNCQRSDMVDAARWWDNEIHKFKTWMRTAGINIQY